MTEQTGLGQAIEKHWREHRPRMVKELVKKKLLNQAVLEAQELTGNLLYELVSVKRMDYHAAWELVMREWALLPEKRAATKPNRSKSSRKSNRNRKRRHRRISG